MKLPLFVVKSVADMFDIKRLTIYEKCQYRKNLEAREYLFGKTKLKEFFGKDVTLHTIVGKNGSGKSSLLDIMFRMVNNVGAVMCKQEIREAADRVRYVRHIFADLEYDNGELYKLCIRDTLLWIENGHDVYWLSDGTLKSKAEDVNVEFCYGQLTRRYGDAHIHDYSDMRPLERKKDIANMLFYTIATNYSMVGFQAADYEDEDSLEWENDIYVTTSDGLYIVTSDEKYVTMADWVEKKNWITGVFHKNDGYMCPIVLNPFRNDGQINIDNEAALTVSRLSALFISERMDKHSLVEAFLLDKISYELKSDFYKRFKPIYTIVKDQPVEEKKNVLAEGGDLKRFKEAANKQGTAAWIILTELSCPLHPNLSETEVSARMYLVYKILNIAGTYPHYSEFLEYGDIEMTLDSKELKLSADNLRKLVREVYDRNTHIEQKVHQVLNFITTLNDLRLYHVDIDTEWLDHPFTYEDYRDHLELPTEFDSIEECLRSLPPNIFRQSIYMKRKREDGNWDTNIPFAKLSSGQKQILFQLSTLIYHLLNLKSVPDAEIQYRDVNIVLDEIEVCFHPEYQRMFVTRILDMLVNRLHLNDTFDIHIWQTTHSPFVLSDIPEGNIVYMEEGHQLTKDEMKERRILPAMAANVNDILHQSFFLEKGFVGEFARQKVLSLVAYLEERENRDDWTPEKAKLFIKEIGEPLVREQLLGLYRESNVAGVQDKIALYREEIERLERRQR